MKAKPTGFLTNCTFTNILSAYRGLFCFTKTLTCKATFPQIHIFCKCIFYRTTFWTWKTTACRETSTEQNVIAKQILEQPETFKITGRNYSTLQPPDVYRIEEDIKYITKKELPRAQEKVKGLTLHDRNPTYHKAKSKDKSYLLLEMWSFSQILQGVSLLRLHLFQSEQVQNSVQELQDWCLIHHRVQNRPCSKISFRQ